MNEIYWITRLDAINTFMVICFLTSILSLIVSLPCFIEAVTLREDRFIKICKRGLITSILVLIISGLGLIFIPTTKEALCIYGIDGTFDYIKDNGTPKGLPDKAVKALDKYLDELLQDKQNGKDSQRRKTF